MELNLPQLLVSYNCIHFSFLLQLAVRNSSLCVDDRVTFILLCFFCCKMLCLKQVAGDGPRRRCKGIRLANLPLYSLNFPYFSKQAYNLGLSNWLQLTCLVGFQVHYRGAAGLTDIYHTCTVHNILHSLVFYGWFTQAQINKTCFMPTFQYYNKEM